MPNSLGASGKVHESSITNAVLRRLPLKDAKAILRENGVTEDEIKKISRWEIIDVLHNMLSDEKVFSFFSFLYYFLFYAFFSKLIVQQVKSQKMTASSIINSFGASKNLNNSKPGFNRGLQYGLTIKSARDQASFNLNKRGVLLKRDGTR